MRTIRPDVGSRAHGTGIAVLAIVFFLHASGFSSLCADLVDSRTAGAPEMVFLDVRDFGATPNNPGDDDAVYINMALDNAAAKGIDTVYVPAGTWDVATSVKVPSNTTLRLSNNAILRLKAGARLAYGIVTNRNAAMGDFKTDAGVRITGGTIDGNNVVPAAGENRGIFLCKCSWSVIEDVTVRDTTSEGIRVLSIDGKRVSEHVVVRSCAVIRKQYTVENILLSTHVDDPRNSAAKPAATRYCRVEGCYSSGGSHGIAFSNAGYCAAVNNVCEGNAHRGIILSPTCEDCIVSGNVVRRAGSTGIHLAYNARRCVISGNIVTGTVADGSGLGNEGQGIKAYAGFRDLIITGNQVSSNATDGIALEGGGESADFVISNNISAENRRDGIRIFAGKITLEKSHDISGGTISGNSCRYNRESGIRLGSDHPAAKAVSTSVSGNSLHHNGRWGIHADATTGLSIGQNTHDANGSGAENVMGVAGGGSR